MKEQVLKFNMIRMSYPERVLSPSYSFWETIGISSNQSFTDKAIISNEVAYEAYMKVQVLSFNEILTSSP